MKDKKGHKLVVWPLYLFISFFLLGAFASCHRAPRPKVALVLGGGGAKGAATIGVLKYIEKAGVPIDFIVGTSIGSVIGGLYSVGYTADEIDSIFRAQHWYDFVTSDWNLISPSKLLKWRWDWNENDVLGLEKGEMILTTLDDLLGHREGSFDELPIPFRCIAVNVDDFTEVCLDSGNVAKCIRASMSLPFLFSSVKMDGMELVDGGMLNNLPVDVARNLGADIVIAIDLSNDSDFGDGISQSSFTDRGLKAVLTWFYKHPDRKKYKANRDSADLLIHPDVDDYHLFSFREKDLNQLVKRGEAAGFAALDSLNSIADRVKR